MREEKGGNRVAHVPWPRPRNWFRTLMVTGAGLEAEGCREVAHASVLLEPGGQDVM